MKLKLKKLKIYIFLDESGTLPDPKDHFVVLVAIATDSHQILSRFQGKSKKEIKFYSAGEKTRINYLTALANEPVTIFTLGINKGDQKIPDSPQNYAVLSWLLLNDCLAFFQDKEVEIIFDRHFHRVADEETLFETLQELLGQRLKIRSGDSAKETGIMAADMVAGAFLYTKSGKSNKFCDLIKDKIVSEKIINWKQAKASFIQAQKTRRTGVYTHPTRFDK